MSEILWKKIICCPNCRYEGPVMILGTQRHLLKWWLLALAGFVLHPLVGLIAIVVIWLAFKPAQYVCPECGCEIPIFLRSRFLP